MNDIFNSLNLEELLLPLNELRNCNFCPRNCGADRFSKKLGYCNSNATFNVASVFLHKGEEPVISGENGICNVFFTHCNLQCIYCQNYQISDNSISDIVYHLSLKDIIFKIIKILDQGCNILGFVSPSHFIPQMKVIINCLHKMGKHPVVVYNTNAYDKVEVLKSIENYVDVYLPDFKYLFNDISQEYSKAENYPEIAKASIKEMFRQKGAALKFDKKNQISSGLIIRHLILPGLNKNTKAVLKYIAEEISPEINISIMSQYYPTKNVSSHKNIGRSISQKEYDEVIEYIDELGFDNGWIQDLSSNNNYIPDFFDKEVFKND